MGVTTSNRLVDDRGGSLGQKVWRLKGRIAIHPLNQNIFLLGFDSSEEAIWVMENGSRIFRGIVMQLEWWTPLSGCKGRRDQETEV